MLIYVLYLSSTVKIDTRHIFSNVHYQFYGRYFLYIIKEEKKETCPIVTRYLAGFIFIIYLLLTVS